MSKQRIDEMKKYMQIAEGNVAEAKVDPKLKKAAKLMKNVADGLHNEYEERMNAAGDDASEIEFAEYALDDAKDYQKIVKMLLAGRGKQAAKFYDGLDTVAREFIYDHLEENEIEFLQKVFGTLGSNWLFTDHEDDYDDDEYGNLDEEGSIDELISCPVCDSECDKVSVKRGVNSYKCRECGEEFTWVGSPFDNALEETVCEKCGREGCECGPDCDCEPVEEDRDPDGMGYYNVTISVNGEYPDEVETAVDYDTAVDTAKDVAEAWKKGRWQMQTWNKGDAKEWHVRGDDGRMDEWWVVIRVEPSEDADIEENISLRDIAEAAITGKLVESEEPVEVEEEFKLPMGMEFIDEDDDPDEDGDGVIDDDEIDRMIDVGDDEDYEYNDDFDLDDLGFSIDLDDEY